MPKDCLVVDDSRVVRMVAKQILTEFGFSIREAEDGQQAMAACNQKMPDLIMLDWNMPVMTGIEFLELLRKSPKGDQPKVMFCTTENDIAHIQRAIALGANEYIMKPFDRNIVQAKLELLGLL